MTFDDVSKYRKAIAEHFNLKHMADANRTTGKMYGHPGWAADLYNDLAKMQTYE
jgi:hypothetical protein